MSNTSKPIWALMICGGLAACGGGGGGGGGGEITAPPAPSTAFKALAAPAGFEPGVASLKSVNVSADALLAGGAMPAGYADPGVYTWVNFSYADDKGARRTLAVVRWTALARIGPLGLRLELPSGAAALHFDVYNANGTRAGDLPL